MSRIKRFDLALRIAGFNFNKEAVELIVRLYEEIGIGRESVTLEEITAIIQENEDKYQTKE